MQRGKKTYWDWSLHIAELRDRNIGLTNDSELLQTFGNSSGCCRRRRQKTSDVETEG